jgi:hypothetical protein
MYDPVLAAVWKQRERYVYENKQKLNLYLSSTRIYSDNEEATDVQKLYSCTFENLCL